MPFRSFAERLKPTATRDKRAAGFGERQSALECRVVGLPRREAVRRQPPPIFFALGSRRHAGQVNRLDPQA